MSWYQLYIASVVAVSLGVWLCLVGIVILVRRILK